MKTVKLAIMGFGNAAQAFTSILIQKKNELEGAGYNFQITAVTTGSKGNLENKEGIDPNQLLSHLKENGNLRSFDSAGSESCKSSELQTISQKTTQEIIETAEYDVMVELTPLNIFTGQPAISHIETALKRKKHVITANKGPIAWDYERLRALAEAEAVQFLYETTVMDGTPIFNMVKSTLPYCKVLEIKGILNSTTNFILGEMEKGTAYEDIMEEGRRRGFVEADPSMDTEGWDAAAKLTALMNVLMDAKMTPNQVDRQGINDITIEDIHKAAEENASIKLLCHAQMTPEGVKAVVRPEKIQKTEIYANIDATSSIISIKTDLMGELSIIEHNPEIEQTGFGIFSDLITLMNRL